MLSGTGRSIWASLKFGLQWSQWLENHVGLCACLIATGQLDNHFGSDRVSSADRFMSGSVRQVLAVKTWGPITPLALFPAAHFVSKHVRRRQTSVFDKENLSR